MGAHCGTKEVQFINVIEHRIVSPGTPYKTLKDDNLGDQAIAFGNQHKFADMTWYPAQQKVAYRIDDRIPSYIPGNGRSDHIKFRTQPSEMKENETSKFRTRKQAPKAKVREDSISVCDNPSTIIQSNQYSCKNDHSRAVLLYTIHLFLLLRIAFGSPPGDPVQCLEGTYLCIVTNFMGVFIDRTICKAREVSYPASEQDLIELMAVATKSNRKMKVTTRYSHSLTRLVCPDGDQGLLISTQHLDNIVKIDKEVKTMTVESGMTLEKLIKEAAKAGLPRPYTPNFWGLTIGGFLSTGAHGSSLWGKGSVVHEYVIELRIVNPGTQDIEG